jgi:hypothetical protein
MGREATCTCRWGADSGEVKVLLEADELIVRGAFRRSAPRAAIAGIEVDGDSLHFVADGEPVALALGPTQAARWRDAMLKATPTLTAKLGVGPGALAHFIGDCDDADLAAALAGSLTDDPAAASVLIARVDAPAALDAARRLHSLHHAVPLWVVYRKGAASPFGETAVRTAMRSHGYIDTKVAGVSATLTAAKFMFRGEDA